MVRRLPVFKGYVVDLRLKQFRKVLNEKIIFLDFNSEKGERLLSEYINSLSLDSMEFNEIKENIRF